MRFMSKIRSAAVLATSSAALVAVLPMTAANASTGNVCVTGSNGWKVCLNISGSGSHIDSFKGWAENQTTIRWNNLHIELTGPNGKVKNCAAFSLDNGKIGPACTWSPNATETFGSYCTILWWHFGGTTYNEEGEKCANG
jgi:hypothetical protein